jgi:hypothetical protein
LGICCISAWVKAADAPICSLRHPTTLSYHPEKYNYRYFYNIVGHETFSHSANPGIYLPSASRPEQIPVPAPRQQTISSSLGGSAHLSGAREKNLSKF